MKPFFKPFVILSIFLCFNAVQIIYSAFSGAEVPKYLGGRIVAFVFYATIAYFAWRKNRVAEFLIGIVLFLNIFTVFIGTTVIPIEQFFLKTTFIIIGAYFFVSGFLFIQRSIRARVNQ